MTVIFSCGMGNVAASNPGDTIYVNSSGGSDLNNGSSWLYAKQSISSAIGTVNTNGTVKIANGKYTGSNNNGISIDKNMTIIGQSQKNTIINGQQSGQSIFIINSGITVKLINLTFTNNTATYGGAISNNGNLIDTNNTFNNNSAEAGGAIFNSIGSTITGTNDTFTNNIATEYGGGGGAIFDEDNVVLIESNDLFKNNIANVGGAISCGTDPTNRGTSTLTNDTFNNNTATNNIGGAITNFHGTLTSTNDTFINNHAPNGGVLYNEGILTDTNDTFTNNTATLNGGAIYNDGIATATKNTFTNNSANWGSAFFNNQGSNSVVEFNRIVGNSKSEIYSTYDLLNANLNWWGTNNNPSGFVNSYVNITSWLVLTIKANPNTIPLNTNSIVTVDLLHTNNGTLISKSISNVLPVTFKTTLGNITNTPIINGKTQSTLNSGVKYGIATVSATVDNQLVKTAVTIKSPITPKVIKTNPKYHAINIPLTTSITITFNENIQKGINYNNIYIKNLNTGKQVHINKSISKNTLTIKMTKSRLYHDKYIIYIPKNAFKDQSGNLTAAYTIPFKTIIKWKE